MKHFISRALHVTHSQWIYHIITLHNGQRGYPRLKDRAAILSEIEILAETDPHKLPAERKFLLEFDFVRLCNSDILKSRNIGLL